jgi:hypothetical protein
MLYWWVLVVLAPMIAFLLYKTQANDVQLCGRVLIFIVRLYPLSDKSGLNLGGTINAGLPLPVEEVNSCCMWDIGTMYPFLNDKKLS